MVALIFHDYEVSISTYFHNASADFGKRPSIVRRKVYPYPSLTTEGQEQPLPGGCQLRIAMGRDRMGLLRQGIKVS